MTYPGEYTSLDVFELLQPETAFEFKLLQDAELLQGMLIGEPRYGHPEGKVFLHVKEVCDNIDLLHLDGDTRRKLRIIAIVHDAFKHIEDKSTPRDWSKHHAVLAGKFLAPLSTELDVVTVTELHDEAYYCWRMWHLENQPEASTQRLNELLWRLGSALQLFYLFFKCDTRTGDKTQAPIRWFESQIKGITLVDF
jgi:hypothetical protein